MRRAVAIGLTCVGLVAAGCGGGGRPGPDPLPKDQLVAMTRAGRAPFDDVRIVVPPDRHVIISNRYGSKVFAFPRDIFLGLRIELAQAHFSTLSVKPDRAIPGPDAHRYAITYRGRTIGFEESTVPAPLRRTVKLLSDFLGLPPQPHQAMVRIRRTGGFAPVPISVYVDYDGRTERFEGTGRRMRTLRYHLAPQALTQLKRGLERIALADVPASSVPPPADGYVYEVTANGRTIRAPQGKVPPLLGPVVAFARSR